MLKAQRFKIPNKLHESITVQVDKANSFYSKLNQHDKLAP